MLPGKNPRDAGIILTVQCLQILQHNDKFRYYAYTTCSPKSPSPWAGNESRPTRPHMRLSTDAVPRSNSITASLDPEFMKWSSTSSYVDWSDHQFRLWKSTERELDLEKNTYSLHEWRKSEHWSASMDEGLQSWTWMTSTSETNKALGPRDNISGVPETMSNVQQSSTQPRYHNVH